MNEVEETLQVLKTSIEFHKLRIMALNETCNFIKELDIPAGHMINLKRSLQCNKNYHEYSIIKADAAREEILTKYNLGR